MNLAAKGNTGYGGGGGLGALLAALPPDLLVGGALGLMILGGLVFLAVVFRYM